MVTPDTALWLAAIGIALAVPLTFMVANWVRKNVDHGEMRFGPDGKVLNCGTCGRPLNAADDPMSTDCGGDCWGCVGVAEIGGELEGRVRSEIAKGLRRADGYPNDGYYT